MKYGNKKTTCNQNHRHDSKKEASYCDDLALLKKAGELVDYKVGEKIILQDKFTMADGTKVRAITYTPDFIVYWYGGTEIVDVKSKPTMTTSFKLKWKMLQKMYQHEPSYKLTIVD